MITAAVAAGHELYCNVQREQHHRRQRREDIAALGRADERLKLIKNHAEQKPPQWLAGQHEQLVATLSKERTKEERHSRLALEAELEARMGLSALGEADAEWSGGWSDGGSPQGSPRWTPPGSPPRSAAVSMQLRLICWG
jgi:hypothetical protein